MFNTRLARVVFFILIIASFYMPVYFYPLLPENIASHFSTSNSADGWMHKENYMLIHYGILILFTSIFCGMALLLHRIPDSLMNLPNKTYWLNDQRRTHTLNILRGMLYWLGCLCLLIFDFIFYKIYKTNIDGTNKLGFSAWVGLIIFVAANGLIIIRYIFYFNQKDNK